MAIYYGSGAECPAHAVGVSVFKDEQTMSRSEQRRLALRFSLTVVAWLACLFAWVSILSFDVADWPSASVWPANLPPRNWCGSVGAWFAYQFFYYLGLGTYPLLLLATAGVAAWTHQLRLPDAWLRCLGVGLVCAATSTTAAMFVPASGHFLVSGPGGILGTAAADFLRSKLQAPGTLIVVTCALLVGLILAADQVVVGLLRWLVRAGSRAGPAVAQAGGRLLANAGTSLGSEHPASSGRLATAPAGPGQPPDGGDPQARTAAPARQLPLQLTRPDATGEPTPEPADEEPPDPAPVASLPTPKPCAAPAEVKRMDGRRVAATPAAGREVGLFPPPSDADYQLPAPDLLDDPEPFDRESIEILCREKAFVLEQTLNEFHLEVQVVAIETGPVITVFELKLAPGIKVSQIASLANDMARALKAPAVRVVSPLPGKNTIGIEVPNVDKERVRLKELMHLAAGQIRGYAVPLLLGKDAAGQPLVADLARMPHLLIAGTTGSGKSVCIASAISSILLTRTPAQVNLILVDPKVVELALFKDIPHLISPIVTELSRAEAILDWAATKMDERYALLAEAGVKDIRSYNRLGPDELRRRMQVADDEELARIPLRLPYVVIVIDELADLMMTSAKEVEFFLCRLAQKSRAVGIHLLVSTQRPQANVVTGLIKSNMPCRIAFRVASRLDSRIVLDQNGGEALMGQGDMLFLPPGSSKLVRAQGTFVSERELRAIVEHVRSQGAPQYHPELTRITKPGGETSGERDELFDRAVEIVIDSGRGSVSLLQRRLTIGYGRASRLIDQMYDAGIVGEYKGSQAREVIMTREQWEALKAARDQEGGESGRASED